MRCIDNQYTVNKYSIGRQIRTGKYVAQKEISVLPPLRLGKNRGLHGVTFGKWCSKLYTPAAHTITVHLLAHRLTNRLRTLAAGVLQQLCNLPQLTFAQPHLHTAGQVFTVCA
jgi:hypothetical protein